MIRCSIHGWRITAGRQFQFGLLVAIWPITGPELDVHHRQSEEVLSMRLETACRYRCCKKLARLQKMSDRVHGQSGGQSIPTPLKKKLHTE